ncbi:MAG TPA: phospholipase D-like domain-containing protein [Nocardioides sp.]|nr:phospholipase D-like domain-containing protein [Nocardioides sp.]
MRKSRYLVAATILSVAVSSQVVAGPAGATRAVQQDISRVAAPEAQQSGPAKRPRYRPKPGVTFNRPGQQSINDKVLRAIRHSQRGSKIRAMTWNFNSWVFVKALRGAHKRGVSVRIIMARRLAEEQGRGGPYNTLRRALQRQDRKPEMRSWFHTCSHSCRGKGGSMHSKMYLFSKTGSQPRVVMSSSANMTGASATAQYNDMFTVVGSKRAYRGSIAVFNEASRDRPARPRVYADGSIRGWFQPRSGLRDLVSKMLSRVKCRGARGAGINGRTSLRIAQDVILGQRGIRIARQIKQLHRNGCNIRLVYSQLGGNVWRILQGVPRNHLVRDVDGDGAYDIYLHMKAMAISGHYGGRRGARIVYQGSENWSGLASVSDEQGLIIDRGRVERKYGAQINRLFGIHLRSARPLPAAKRVSDPYMNMEG